jgi:glycosyltransferase involved in cell wall biosynthesis
MELTVLSVAFPFAPVGRDAVGGAEQILGTLDEALVARGHRSIVIACEGSKTAGELIPVRIPSGRLDGGRRKLVTGQVQEAIDGVVRFHHIDIVHMHGFDFFEYTVPGHIPLLVTLHLPIPWYPERAWSIPHPRVHFQCVSAEQRAAWTGTADKVSVIANGVPLPPFRREARQDFAVVMGRICPEKNAHEALEAATLRGTRVFIAGQVFPYAEHEQYFAQKISPWLSKQKPSHRFLGPLSREERWRLLSSARCLLHPTLAPETSSLAAMEALAAGTPVIAYRSGALAGIVEHGVTGFLVSQISEMADAIGRVDSLSSEDCRGAAERRFSQSRMIEQYFELYEELLRESRPEKHCA